MASVYTSDGHLWRDILIRVLIVLGTTFLIVLALPPTDTPTVEIKENKPWVHASLIASFDYQVRKPESVIKQEQQAVTEGILPYYTRRDEIKEEQLKRFRTRYADGIEGLPKSFVSAIERKLAELYDAGIIEQNDYARHMKDTASQIQVVIGKTTKSTSVKQTLTPITAYSAFFHDPQMEIMRAKLQDCNINDYIKPNLIYDAKRSDQEKQDRLNLVVFYSGEVQKGEKIVDRGEIIDYETACKLRSYFDEMKKSQSDESRYTTLLGHIIFILLLMATFTTYLHLFRGDYFRAPRSLAMVYSLIVLFPVLVSMMIRFTLSSIYLVPFAMVPMFIRVFLDSRTAFMAHTTMILACSVAVTTHYEFIIIQLLAGLVAIYSLRELSKRSQIFSAALFVTVAIIIVYYSTQLMQPGDADTIDHSYLTHFIFSGVLLLLVYPLMFLVEKMFGFTSAVTLFELSDTNKDLLRRLSEVAPGTFQHSIMVGNLAAAIASRIGAKSLLVRTGALYHDIGKLANPVFFTENQAGTNPHDRMTPIESAQVIINHVTEGVRFVEKQGLPTVIRDFILTHHGKGMAKYFYITYRNEHPGEEIDESLFSYPGPNPFTLEQAILMMADGVEAASRSLPEYTEESITNLVNRIIDGIVESGAFVECPITYRDISITKQVLIEKLKSIYHTRISYPELKKN